jgi:tetratricopeptide (TPR) repeat protein
MNFDSRASAGQSSNPTAAGCGRGTYLRSLALALLSVLLGSLAPNPFSAAGQNSSRRAETTICAAENCGSITGTARDDSDAPLSGVRITLLGEGTGSRQSVVTDGNGKFTFTRVEAGAYAIEAEAADFQKSARSHLVVDGGKRLLADFRLVRTGPRAAPPAKAGGPASERADAGSALGGFNYYDGAGLKPAKVNIPLDPGGYSAAHEVDSYSLMLDYLEAEGASSPPEGGRAAGAHGSSLEPSRGATTNTTTASGWRPTAAELDAWSESQFLARGSRLLLNRQITPSVEIFQAGVRRFPNSVKLHTGLGIALSARGEYQKAITSLLHAADLAPSDPRPYFVLAKAYSGSSVLNGEVAKRLHRLLSLDPGDPQARYYCALALVKGNTDDTAALKEAEALLQSAVGLDPNFADAHLQLGTLYAARSNHAEAIREYQTALRLRPDLAMAHYRLAQAYARTGRKTAAQAELDSYERLRNRTPSSPR